MKNGYMCCKLLLNRLLRFVAGRKEVDGLSGDKKIVKDSYGIDKQGKCYYKRKLQTTNKPQ